MDSLCILSKIILYPLVHVVSYKIMLGFYLWKKTAIWILAKYLLQTYKD